MPSQPIPIKNLFYMLCYAWNVLPVRDTIKVSPDDFSDAFNLLAKVFSIGVGKVIRSGFHRSYINTEEELSTLRGKIDVQSSISRLTIQNKRLVCEFDEYSTNDTFNQIVKYTIRQLIGNAEIDKKIKKDLKKQLFYFAGIDELIPTKDVRRTLVFNQNNTLYRFIICVAILIYDNTTVNEDTGNCVFADFYREEQMQRVFELFILNFYAAHLNKDDYKVSAPKVNWPIDEQSIEKWKDWFNLDTNPGDRRTDVVIESKPCNSQFILDAKYYRSALIPKYHGYGEETYRTAHLNQIRGYILDSSFEGDKLGALIYPAVNHDFSRGTLLPIRDANIIIKTVDLNSDWREIEKDLLGFIIRLERRAE